MLKYRLISFPLLIAIAAAMFIWKEGGSWLFLTIATIGVGMAVYEAGFMLNKSRVLRCYPRFAGIVSAFLVFWAQFQNCVDLGSTRYALYFNRAADLMMLLCLVAPAIMLIKRIELEKIIGTFGVLGTIFVPLFYAVSSWNIVLPHSHINGLLFLIAVSKSMDTGGYIFGMLSSNLPGGNHKIAPSISPKKSWEGFLGGMAMTLAVSSLFCYYAEISRIWCALIGFVLGMGSFFGDLTESALKRRCGVKDSGNYIPGMGGVLDVFDSFLYNGILFAFMLSIYSIFGK